MDGRRRTMLLTLGLVAVALGLVAASVPLYRLFCQVTGISGAERVASDFATTGKRTVTVRFDTNVMPGLPWGFEPERNSITVHLGETNLALFTAVNNSAEPIVGTAVFNVAPPKAARYVDKIQCFCFTRQSLAAGERAELPVSFFIDPKIAEDSDTAELTTLTLSYTFYKSRDQAVGANDNPALAAPVGAGAKSGKEGKS